MKNKTDNGLFKVTNDELHYVHWFTSLGRVSAVLGIFRNTVEYCYLRNKPTTNGYKIELVDGTDIKYKDIN